MCLEAERNFTRKMTGKFTLNFKEKPYMNTVNMSLYGQGRVTLCFIKYKKGDIYRTSLNQCNGHKLVLTYKNSQFSFILFLSCRYLSDPSPPNPPKKTTTEHFINNEESMYILLFFKNTFSSHKKKCWSTSKLTN